MLKFDVFLEKIPCTRSKKGFKIINEPAFWERAEERYPGISSAKGCYVFGLSAAGGMKPHYVGKATKTFKQEVFAAGKRNHYLKCMNDKSGTPIIILIAAITNKGQLAQGVRDGAIAWIEEMLINSALLRNPDLINRQKIAYAKSIIIPGFMNTVQGQSNHSGATALRNMFFGTRR